MKITRPHIILLSFAVIVTLIIIGSDLLIRSSEVPLVTLQSTPDHIYIENRKYQLETYLWRDFMPISPPDGQPLIAVVKIIPNDSLKFPSNLDADHLWVVNGKELWSTSFSSEKLPEDEYLLEKIARNGPKWATGVQVDVIVRLVHNHQKSFLLRAFNQTIERTE